MARRKNPYATLVLLLLVLGFGYGSWHLFVEERIQDRKKTVVPPAEEAERLKAQLNDVLSTEEGYLGISAFNWRQGNRYYRIDVTMRDGTTQTVAKAIARRASEVIERATDGTPAEVSVMVLNREVAHHVP